MGPAEGGKSAKPTEGGKKKFIEQVEKSVDNPVARAAIEEFAPDDGDGTSEEKALKKSKADEDDEDDAADDDKSNKRKRRTKPAEGGKSAKPTEGGKEKFIEQVEKSVDNPVARAAIEEFAPDDGGEASEEKPLKKFKA